MVKMGALAAFSVGYGWAGFWARPGQGVFGLCYGWRLAGCRGIFSAGAVQRACWLFCRITRKRRPGPVLAVAVVHGCRARFWVLPGAAPGFSGRFLGGIFGRIAGRFSWCFSWCFSGLVFVQISAGLRRWFSWSMGGRIWTGSGRRARSVCGRCVGRCVVCFSHCRGARGRVRQFSARGCAWS